MSEYGNFIYLFIFLYWLPTAFKIKRKCPLYLCNLKVLLITLIAFLFNFLFSFSCISFLISSSLNAFNVCGKKRYDKFLLIFIN